jgi:hypothetical protein
MIIEIRSLIDPALQNELLTYVFEIDNVRLEDLNQLQPEQRLFYNPDVQVV